jgi:M61 glycyl aminopeptidase
MCCVFRARQVSVSVGGFNRCSVDDKTKQQEREHARKRAVRSGNPVVVFSGHVFERYVRVLNSNIRMPNRTVKPVSARLQPAQSPTLSHFARKTLGWGVCRTILLFRRSFLLFVCGFLLLTSLLKVDAQTIRTRISVISLAPARVRIDVDLPTPTDVLSFPNVYAGVLGLGERIEKTEAIGAGGRTALLQKIAPGEFQSSEKFTRFSYVVDLREPARPAQMSHVSWLNREQGLLMLADLFPLSSQGSTVSVQLDIPAGWSARANVQEEGVQHYSTTEPAQAVFLIGPDLRVKNDQIASINFSIIMSGQWPFSDASAAKLVGKILEQYSKATRFKLRSDAFVMLIPFPADAGPDRWSAETRGNDVVLLLGRRATGDRVLATLGIVLAHELFHLWVPNSLKLTGDYDWFFEGFTLYEALRMDLRLGFISFDDYLNTIARVYASYLSAAERDKLSLIQASQRRWTTSSAVVYDRGMLVAFVYDLMLRHASNCKASLDDVYRQLFRSYSTGQGSANEIIIRLLEEHEGLQSFGQDYVLSTGKINLESVLSLYGLQIEQGMPGTKATRLAVARDIREPQRKNLRCLRNEN